MPHEILERRSVAVEGVQVQVPRPLEPERDGVATCGRQHRHLVLSLKGSLKGRKHGRPSHHPLLAVLAEAKIVLHPWLRSGNAGTARGVRAFLAETLARLPEGGGRVLRWLATFAALE